MNLILSLNRLSQQLIKQVQMSLVQSLKRDLQTHWQTHKSAERFYMSIIQNAFSLFPNLWYKGKDLSIWKISHKSMSGNLAIRKIRTKGQHYEAKCRCDSMTFEDENNGLNYWITTHTAAIPNKWWCHLTNFLFYFLGKFARVPYCDKVVL